jgi:hypothetical protein
MKGPIETLPFANISFISFCVFYQLSLILGLSS